MITGRGLFIGNPRRLTAQQWEAMCIQAQQWGMNVIHPKVAEGVYPWYDQAGMLMLRDIAHKHGLEIMPYHWWWGGNVGEATLAADIANFFDGCCPDIEDPFNNQPGWAT